METPRDTSLMLVVLNPKKLFKLKKPNSNYDRIVNDNIFIISDRGKRTYAGDKNHDYNTDVWMTKGMSWEISLTDPRTELGYKISLAKVEGHPISGNPNLFEPNPAYPDSKGIITGVINNACEIGDEEKYSITFTITRYDGETNEIDVDPKLKIIGGGE